MSSNQAPEVTGGVKLAEGPRIQRNRYDRKVRKRVKGIMEMKDSPDPEIQAKYRDEIKTARYKSDIAFLKAWAEIRSDDHAGRDAELKRKMDFDARYEAEQVAKEAADREALREGKLQARKERKALEMEKLRTIAAAHERGEKLDKETFVESKDLAKQCITQGKELVTETNELADSMMERRAKSNQTFYDAVASIGNEMSGACVGSKRSASLEDQPSQRSKRVKFAEVPTLECEESAGLDSSEGAKDSGSELKGLPPGGESFLETDSLEDEEEMQVSELEVDAEESPAKLKALEEEWAAKLKASEEESAAKFKALEKESAAKLKAVKEEAAAEVESSRTDLERSESDKGELVLDNELLCVEKTVVEKELADSRAINGKFSKLLGDAKGEVATFELKFEHLADKHATLKSQFERLAGKHAKEQEACRSLVGQLRAANSQLEKLQQENEKLRKQKSDSEALESKLKRRCTGLQDKLLDYGSEVAEVKSKYQNEKELASRLKEQNIRQKEEKIRLEDLLRQNGIEVPEN